ncbi:MAG TPA: alpha/beta hydrolase [Acidimicrobiales bacterium]|nr:alpha/beta hydrolase [Acidimicrobiales bacterium]
MRRIPSTDGVEVAVHDLGGDGPALVLVHATGFCGGVLGPLAAALSGSFHAWAIDVRGHGTTATPDGLDFRWTGFSDDVLAVLDWLRVEGAAPDGVFGFGHSSGGAAVLDAEARRPGTFRALYCYEPIVWPTPPPAASRDLLVEGALRRRDTFDSRDAARANFAAKPPFSGLASAALDAYVACGFEDADGGGGPGGPGGGLGGGGGPVRLRCRREWEASVYREGLAHDGFSRLGAVECPVVVASGDRWEALDRDIVARQAAALPHGRIETFRGLGHLGPMEDPAAVAASVATALAN